MLDESHAVFYRRGSGDDALVDVAADRFRRYAKFSRCVRNGTIGFSADNNHIDSLSI